MGRKPRVQSETGLYHVIVRGNNKRSLFQGEEDFKKFLGLLSNYLTKYSVKLHHYCLMTNHVHLLVWAEAPKDLGSLMHSLERSYHHYFRKRYTFFGHLFQGRYKSLSIQKESYLLECGRYIERNPVRAFMVNHPKDWPYSSYRSYAFGESEPFLTDSVAYLGLAHTGEERQRLYRDYVEDARPYEELLDKQLIEA